MTDFRSSKDPSEDRLSSLESKFDQMMSLLAGLQSLSNTSTQPQVKSEPIAQLPVNPLVQTPIITPVPAATHVRPSVQLKPELFGVYLPNSFSDAPKYSATELFSRWETAVHTYAGKDGLAPLITLPPSESWPLALAKNTNGIPITQLSAWYIQTGTRMVHAIIAALTNAHIDREQLLAEALSLNNGTSVVDGLVIEADANPHLIMRTLRVKLDTRTQYASMPLLLNMFSQSMKLTATGKGAGIAHFYKFKEAFKQLFRVLADEKPKEGDGFNETLQSIIILASLPSDLSTEIKILTSKERISLSEVEGLLRKHDDLRPTQSKGKVEEKANAFTQGQSKKQKGKGKPNKRPDNKGHGQQRQHSTSASDSDDIENLKTRTFLMAHELPAGLLPEPDSSTESALATQYSTRDSRLVILDSGATRHSWSQGSQIVDKEDLVEPLSMITASGHTFPVKQKGRVQITGTIAIKDVIHVPQLKVNLLSVHKITRAGYVVVFYGDHAVIQTPKNKMVLKFMLRNGLYVRELEADDRLEPQPKEKRTDGLLEHSPPTKPSSIKKTVSFRDKQAAASSTAKPSSTLAGSNAKQPSTAQVHSVFEVAGFLGQVATDTVTEPTVTEVPGATGDDKQLLHERYGHQSMFPSANCRVCMATRMKRVPITRTPHVSATQPLSTLIADLVGPVSAVVDGARQAMPSLGGNRYILVVVDEYSRYAWTHLVKRKSDVPSLLINQLVMLKRQHSQLPIRRFHTDGGTEFVNRALGDYLVTEGIRQTTTTRDKPSHNGKCERFNQTLINLMRSMIHGANAHPTVWGEAAGYATYTYNRTPLLVIDKKTPYELLYGTAADTSKLHVFGCDAYYALYKQDRSKLQPINLKGVWIGWDEAQNANRVLVDSNSHIIKSRDVRCIDDSFQHLAEIMGETPPATGLINQPSHSSTGTQSGTLVTGPEDDETLEQYELEMGIDEPTLVDDDPITSLPLPTTTNVEVPVQPLDEAGLNSLPDILEDELDDGYDGESTNESEYSDDDTVDVEPLDSNNPALSVPVTAPVVTRYGRVSKPVVHYGAPAVGDYDVEDQQHLMSFNVSDHHVEPTSYKEATLHANAEHYTRAAGEEIASMAAQQVYELVPYHPSMHLIKSKWVFKRKVDQNNQPVKYKARLVAKGFAQRHGVEYWDTYAPVAKQKSIRIILAIAVLYALVIKQIDFVGALLNSYLSEDEIIYMEQPEGFTQRGPDGRHMVWRLKKTIYGLKQSPRKWNADVDKQVRLCGYEPTICDPCIYVKRVDGYPPMFLTLYVDDTLALYHPDLEHIWLEDKATISTTYKISDIGDCSWVLNMEVIQSPDRSTVLLSQRAYVEKMLTEFNMVDCKPAPTPMSHEDLTDPALVPGQPLSIEQHELYRRIVGSALYAANTTRIDIAHTVGMLARFVQAPTTTHLTAAKRLLRYLRGTTDYCLKFETNGDQHLVIRAFADSNWGGDKTNRKSTTGMLLQLNGSATTWQSKKQPTVALSSTEAEYMGLSAATCEILWTKMFIQQLLLYTPAVELFCDNQAAIALVRSDSYSERTKHIDVRHHFIKQHVRSGAINLQWISTDDQLADVLTKTLGKDTHTSMISRIMAT
ncbi:MAG: retrovirus-related Pol polyprotein from transposon 1-94 [Chthonomonadaceae bacterium]|nr:retrovirus-related Pol polyprotein from transposon 1-94 [Chthonomonadaceae bacterium]